MCKHVVKRDIISFVNPYRTPSVFPGPEKRDGEIPQDIHSQSVDCFPPPDVPGAESLLDQVAMPDSLSELKGEKK